MCFVTYSWKKHDSHVKVERFLKNPKVLWAEIDITGACDFNCLYCYADASQKQTQVMELEIYKQIIDKLVDNGFVQITLSGGEPLLHDEIKVFAEYAHENGLIVHMNSNGYYLTEQLAKELKTSGLSQIQMNLDSLDPALHNFLRGKLGAHGRVLKAFKNAIETNITTVLLTVVTTHNVNELKDIMLFSKNEGINRFRVWDMVPQGRGKHAQRYLIENYSSILKDLTRFAIKNGVLDIISYEPTFEYHDEIPSGIKLLEVPCPYARGLGMNIDMEGNVNLASTMRGIKLYNLLKQDNIQEIHKERNEQKFNQLMSKSECQNCDLFLKCSGGCIARLNERKRDIQCPNS